MSVVDSLCREYERVLRLRWPARLSGEERVWMVVYDPPQERRIRARLVQFELATKETGRNWRLVTLESVFPEWLGSNKYREQLFANPKALPGALGAYRTRLAEVVRAEHGGSGRPDRRRLDRRRISFWALERVRAHCIGCRSINGILLVFFPGRHEGTVYRLMDARTNWNYLALAIEPKVGE